MSCLFVMFDYQFHSKLDKLFHDPQNLEILSEFGLIGFILFISLNLMILYKSLKYLKSCYKYKLINNFNIRLLISVFIIFILLIWPIKSTGRISSTFYGTIYWFYDFFLCTLNYKLKLEASFAYALFSQDSETDINTLLANATHNTLDILFPDADISSLSL